MESVITTVDQIIVAVKSSQVIRPLPDAILGTLKRSVLPGPRKTTKQHSRIGYTVVSKGDDYEERWYPASTWVCTTVTGVYQDTAKIEGFRRLQSYTQGHNDTGAFLSIHPPILTRLSTDAGDGFDRKFVISTYLCNDHMDGLPEPDDPDVYLEQMPEIVVFVRSFRGITCEEQWTHETKRLASLLRNKEDIRTDVYFTASYENPYQLVSSKSEIWFIKYDRTEETKQFTKDTSVVRYGDQKLEVPNIVGCVMYLICGYISILSFLFKLSLNSSGYVRDNWTTIKTRAVCASKIVRRHVSFGSILRTSASVCLAVWSIAIEIVSGNEPSGKTFLQKSS